MTIYDTIESNAGPFSIAPGPDGNVWFAQRNTDKIGRVTPDGTMTDFGIGAGSHPFDIFAGPDDHMWFTMLGSEAVGKISMDGTVTLYDLPAGTSALRGTVGPDDNVWFVADLPDDYIFKVTTSGDVTQYDADTGGFLDDIASGPDGKLWYASTSSNTLFNITTSGVTDSVTITTGNVSPMLLESDSQGNLWFKEYSTDSIGRMTAGGVFTTYPIASEPALAYGMNRGPDGRVWFTDPANDKIDVVDFDGTVAEYDAPSGCGVSGVSAGGDGNIWFTCQTASTIGKLAAPTPDAKSNSVTVAANSGPTVILDVTDDVTNSPAPSTLSLVSDASHGSAVVDTTSGTITYTPTAGFSGQDSLTYRVCSIDNSQICTQEVLTIIVSATNATLADTGISQKTFIVASLLLGVGGLTLLAWLQLKSQQGNS